ncbi:Carboxylesterase UNQ440/PRO873-like protein [Camponotus floridanus]|uniref:Carboxylesterase UNQ440/PRO873-like protein n=1 Tax=Camponotus floridanus TaxID=104421 RepID=E2ADW6_CAMFO|nr:Carboxylesterase UNQ440/PRO873-like protein [Camponotus floridanus]
MERVEVCVRDGKLVGIVKKGIYGGRYVAFRGIPYAKPPIGELRFKLRNIFYDNKLRVPKVLDTILFRGLFHKAISQSGTVTFPWALTELESCSTNKGFLLAKKLGKVTEYPKDVYEFLKMIDAKKLIETQKFLATEEERQQFLLIFTPTLDHESSNPVFPGDLTTLIHRGVKVPYLLGFTNCEGSVLLKSNFYGYITKEALSQVDSDFKLAIYPRVLTTLPKIPITLCQLRSLYFGDENISEKTVPNYINLLSDIFFFRGIMQAADIQMNNDNSGKTYLYQFSYGSETSLMKKILNTDFPGVSHSEELCYLFYPDIIKELGLSVPAPDSEDYKMISRLTQMWTDFAKTGNPTPAITDLTPIKWTPLKPAGDVYDYLDIDVKPRMKTFRKGEQRWEWEKALGVEEYMKYSYDHSVCKN